MTTRQRTLKKSAAAAIIALATAGTAIGLPAAPARAAAPKIATSWSTLMYRSLTHDTTLQAMKTSLAGQQAAITRWNTELALAGRAQRGTRALLITATTADTAAQNRYATARTALTSAKQTLSKAQKQKPRSTAVVTRAKKAVAAAAKTVTLRKTQAQTASAKLAEAGKASRAALARVQKAEAGVKYETAAATKTRAAIAALPTAASYATQAATLSKDVVNQVRPAFKVTDTTQVYGVTVNKTVAFAFKRMIDDAKADGVQISGGGFRTTQRQIELRTINGCPDVWTAPSSSCRVPTAIPGRSLHEIGLAVDISSGGKTISSSTAAFKWMKVHAKQYGFVNFPAEAWHWSISGS
ncbi:D-alanyl-D-alanine carboxypeptidase family protein [Actinoplanes cyaneus]|nr:D-alanyl-D-alanine carboxypeptidase family protein [Actinoplanes cyaneus]MCW2142974.1 D-alanyl-D-alanine carboxypeptidase [Actinoplanes cyaneus]